MDTFKIGSNSYRFEAYIILYFNATKISGGMEIIMVYLKNTVPIRTAAIPLKANTITYLRKEKDCYVSILLPNASSQQYKLINETAMEIIDDMDGVKNLSSLFEIYRSRYSSVDMECLEKDFSMVITQLWQDGIIQWKNSYNPLFEDFNLQIDTDISIRVAFEEDINKILSYTNDFEAESNYVNFTSEYLSRKLFDPLQLRYAFFNMTHVFFMIEKENQVIGLVGISNDKSPFICEVAYLNIPNTLLKEVLKRVIELTKIACANYITKMRIYIPKDDKYAEDGLPSVLQDCGFAYITTLEKEINKKDVILLDYIYSV